MWGSTRPRRRWCSQALFGSIGLFFLAFVVDGLHGLSVRHTWLLVLAVVVSLALGLAGPSTRTIYKGAVRAVGAGPLFPRRRRSVVLVPLAVLGGVQLAAWFVHSTGGTAGSCSRRQWR